MKCFAILSIVIAVVISLDLTANAQKRLCTKSEEFKAELEASRLHSWDDLYKSYKLYMQCDDGDIAEGYSESVARILVDHWNSLHRLQALGTKDGAFRRFVLKHVDGTMASEDMMKIKKNATTLCPKTLQKLCSDLKKHSELDQSSELTSIQAKILFNRAMVAAKQHRFDVANLTLQTLVNTYPNSEYAQKAKVLLQDQELGDCKTVWAEPPCVDYRTSAEN
jgi:hypothetical protein